MSLPLNKAQVFVLREMRHCDFVKQHLVLLAGFEGLLLSDLEARAKNHDASKWLAPEREAYEYLDWKFYCRNNNQLCAYDADTLELIQKGLAHHKKNNRHHPEYHKDQNAMSLLDLAEMCCDWTAIAIENGQGFDGVFHWAHEAMAQQFHFNIKVKDVIYRLLHTLKERALCQAQH
jgi:hypothetical protein